MQPEKLLLMPHSSAGANCRGWIFAQIWGGEEEVDLLCTVCGETGSGLDCETARRLSNDLSGSQIVYADRSQGYLRLQCPHRQETTQDFDFATVQVFVCPSCERASLVQEYRQ